MSATYNEVWSSQCYGRERGSLNTTCGVIRSTGGRGWAEHIGMKSRCRSATSSLFIPKYTVMIFKPLLLDGYKYDGHVLFFSSSTLHPKPLSSRIPYTISLTWRGSEQRTAGQARRKRNPNTKTSPRIRSPPTTKATEMKHNLPTSRPFQQRKPPNPQLKTKPRQTSTLAIPMKPNTPASRSSFQPSYRSA